ncbi:hypothetical protein BKA82DRAFT_4330418 [Pisolithus tinctorius]|nr:hypothetical protein BKA82DRAFT_4330418 [Pisolithus tinctorius]
MDVTGVHFIVVNWCECGTAETQYIQLLRAKLFPSTFEKPSTAFTFAVLDDFLRDNLECGTSSMNYYSKLCQITSSVFPHLVPDRYCELLQVVQKWWYLKLLKWNGFQGTARSAGKGGLALFCMACPQPGINVDTNEDLDHWQFTCTVVMDRNFKAEHMHEWKSKDQVWLMDGWGYLVTNPHYVDYLKATPHIAELIDIPSSLWIIPGIGIWHVHGHKKECYAQYAPLFIKGAGWVDGEIIEMLWSVLNMAFTSACGMTSPHHQELLDFQMNDSNFMKIIWIG